MNIFIIIKLFLNCYTIYMYLCICKHNFILDAITRFDITNINI